MSDENFPYAFTHKEAGDFALFLRKYENDLPHTLDHFMETLEAHLYNSMTIDEAEVFFHGKISEN